MGDGPGFGKPPGTQASFDNLTANTFTAMADMDASPTKAWLIQHRDDPEMKPFAAYAFGQRPAEELYDLEHDPDELHNVADDPAYAAAKSSLDGRLMTVLRDTGDPRVTGNGETFDRPPFSDPVQSPQPKKPAARSAR